MKDFQKNCRGLQVDQNTETNEIVYGWFGQQMALLSWGKKHHSLRKVIANLLSVGNLRAQLKLHLRFGPLCGSPYAKHTTTHCTTVDSTFYLCPSFLKV